MLFRSRERTCRPNSNMYRYIKYRHFLSWHISSSDLTQDLLNKTPSPSPVRHVIPPAGMQSLSFLVLLLTAYVATAPIGPRRKSLAIEPSLLSLLAHWKGDGYSGGYIGGGYRGGAFDQMGVDRIDFVRSSPAAAATESYPILRSSDYPMVFSLS